MLPCRPILTFSTIITVLTLVLILLLGVTSVSIVSFGFVLAGLGIFSLFAIMFSLISLVILRVNENICGNRSLIRSFACVILFAIALFVLTLFLAGIFSLTATVSLDIIVFLFLIFISSGLILSILQTVCTFVNSSNYVNNDCNCGCNGN